MSDWQIVIPYPIINRVSNPSAELDAVGFSDYGGASATQSATTQAIGAYAYKIVAAAIGGIELEAVDYTGGGVVVLQAYVRDAPGMLWSPDGGMTWGTPTLIMRLDDDWDWYWLVLRDVQITDVVITATEAATFYVDGVMAVGLGAAEAIGPLTYVDGDQDGCVWRGRPHYSRSQTLGLVRTVGMIYDLQDDLYFQVGGVIGRSGDYRRQDRPAALCAHGGDFGG